MSTETTLLLVLTFFSLLETVALVYAARYVFMTTVREHSTIEMLHRMLLAKNDPVTYGTMVSWEDKVTRADEDKQGTDADGNESIMGERVLV